MAAASPSTALGAFVYNHRQESIWAPTWKGPEGDGPATGNRVEALVLALLQQMS